MTKFDIRNYFEKIYDLSVRRVNTRIQLGKCVCEMYCVVEMSAKIVGGVCLACCISSSLHYVAGKLSLVKGE